MVENLLKLHNIKDGWSVDPGRKNKWTITDSYNHKFLPELALKIRENKMFNLVLKLRVSHVREPGFECSSQLPVPASH